MEIPSSKKSPRTLIKQLVRTVECEYSRQNNTPSPPKWHLIQNLVTQFKDFQNITITGHDQQRIFIDNLLKYMELVMSFLSDFEGREYRKQRSYSLNCLTFIPVIFKEVEFCNLFVEMATAKTIELLTYGKFNLMSKRSLLTVYNSIAAESKKEVRVEVSKSITYLMYQLVDGLATYGDYVIQSDIMEALFRLFGTQILTNEKIAYELFPGSEYLGEALTTDISTKNFDAGLRKWLNKFNENSPLIFTIACKKVMFGNLECLGPPDLETTWVDFNLNVNEQIMGFFLKGSNPDTWNRITILATDVKKIEIKRPLRGGEVTVSIRLAKSCISEEIELQEYINSLDKHLQLIMENKDKDKITKLISTVLPQVFGDAFSHTSSKIAVQSKNVYKPLPIKISRRKSSVSDVSMATSVSKSKSDAPSVEVLKISSLIPVRDPLLPINRDSGTTVKGAQFSRVQQGSSLNDASMGGISDFTKPSSRGDPIDIVSITTSDNLDIFSSRRLTSSIKSDSYGQEAEPKVQDNIVTSSHGQEDLSSSKIEILSGRCSGRSADYSKLTRDTTVFHQSEVFSSSPVKISHQKDLQDISSVFSENSEVFDDGNFQKKNMPKSSSGFRKDSTLDEEFETANDYGQDLEEMLIDNNKVSRFRGFEDEDDNLKKSKSDGLEKLCKNKDTHTNQNKKELVAINADVNDSKVDNILPKPMTRARKEKAKNEDERIVELQMKDTSDSDMDTAEEAPINIQSEEHVDKSAVDNRDDAPVVGDTERYKKIVDLLEVELSQNMEDIFSGPTQAVLPRENLDTEQFTDLSLAVNVGISDNQFSESVQYSENKVDKEIERPNKPDVEIGENKVDVITSDVVDSKDIVCSKQMEGENIIIDLTMVEDDNNKDKGEVKKNTKPKTHDKMKENLGKRTRGPKKNKPLLNTPELLDILDDDVPLDNNALKEIEQKNTEDAAVKKVALVAGKKNFKKKSSVIVRNVKESTVIIEKPKPTKKKPRTLIKTGIKRFELDNHDEIDHIEDDANANKELLKDGEKITNAKPATFPAEEVGVSLQETNVAEGTSEERNILQTSGVVPISETASAKGLLNVSSNQPSGSNEKNLKVLVSKMQIENKDESFNSGPVQSLPSKILSNVVASKDNFDKLKESQEENILLTVNQKEAESVATDALEEQGKKELAVHLTQMNICDENDEEASSNSELELAPEINMANIDYLDAFDQLKKLEENKSSALIQKKTESDIPKCTDTVNPLETKDVSSQSEEVVTTERNNQIVDNNVDTVDKMTDEDEDDDRVLASFILKKSTGHLPGIPKCTATLKPLKIKDVNFQSEEVVTTNRDEKIIDNDVDTVDKMTEDDDDDRVLASFILKKGARHLPESQDKTVKDNLKEKIIVDKKITEPTISHQNNKIKSKVSMLVNKRGKKKQQAKQKNRQVVPSSNQQAHQVTKLEVLKDVATKTPDSSPEVSVHQPIFISSVAQIHWTDDSNTILKPNKEESMTPIKKSKRLAEKRQRSEDFDKIVVDHTPPIKRTRSNDKLTRPVPDDFDQLLNEEVSLTKTLNYSKINTTTGNKSRKLFNQGNYSYLDDLPDITEEKSPQLDDTPIPLIKGTKVPKGKKADTKGIGKTPKTNTSVGQPKKKTEKSFKNKTPKSKSPKGKSPKDKTPTEPSKRRTTPQSKKERKTGFSYNQTEIMSLEQLFNKTCRSVDAATFGGFNYLERPMDIIVRSAPQNVSSDGGDSPVMNLEAPTTPPTPAYSFPDLVVEPYYKKEEPPQKKINILHDVVINPKRRSKELLNESTKRRKIAEEQENIPLPSFSEEDDQTEKNVAETHQRPEEDAILVGLIKVFKYIATLLERRHEPESHNRLKTLIQNTKDNFNI